jgi:hypothetical protein
MTKISSRNDVSGYEGQYGVGAKAGARMKGGSMTDESITGRLRRGGAERREGVLGLD